MERVRKQRVSRALYGGGPWLIFMADFRGSLYAARRHAEELCSALVDAEAATSAPAAKATLLKIRQEAEALDGHLWLAVEDALQHNAH